MGQKAPKQEITESERAGTQTRDRQWQEYLDNKPIQDSYIAASTTDRLDENGSVKIDTSAQQLATESVATQSSLQQFGQGNIDQAIDDNTALATGEANDSSSKAFQDQSDYLTGLDNVSSMGQGLETEATLGQLDQAANANRQAANRANEIHQRRQGNSAAAGQLVGLGLGAYAQRQAGQTSPVEPTINPHTR